ncbi:putative pectinesterase/pectinesterase inhibitor 35 [Triticum urartu]|uniref:Pectinesterase n=1 Tax=Triticum urartu TaxID=4572 RepID=M7ZG95_TRIUA|nr:putative pectinesterase/pectinesterase inhibitor 35 [Triticum urartu]
MASIPRWQTFVKPLKAPQGAGAARKVIYVKTGRYEETVRISRRQRNVMLMGDGKGKTVIVGHRSAADGYTTYASATVAAMGSGFIAKGLTIINEAGPDKSQAVALRVGGDLSVVYQCDIEAYQDTLHTHSNRQFYTEDNISGTVDFIFGNSAVVIQNCDIRPRKRRSGQKDMITAQGRTDRNQNTGISIHKCRIAAASDLGDTKVYLGRPWKKYSRTIVMESSLDRSIAAAGWLEWSGQFALNTLYYGEYGNTGPGAGTSGRVKWAGVHTSLSTMDATRFTGGGASAWEPERVRFTTAPASAVFSVGSDLSTLRLPIFSTNAAAWSWAPPGVWLSGEERSGMS